MELSQQRSKLCEGLEVVTQATLDLQVALEQDEKDGWPAVWQEVSVPSLLSRTNKMITGGAAYDLCAQIYSQYFYLLGQASRQTCSAVGYVVASEKTIRIAHNLNKRKEKFKNLVLQFGDQPGMKNVARRNDKIQKLLSIGHDQALCLQQVYRRILIIEEPVPKLCWFWETNPALKKISRDCAIQKLDKLRRSREDKAFMYDKELTRLASLPSSTPLVQVIQDQSTGLKVRTGLKTGSGRSNWTPVASMPVILSRQQAPRFECPKNTISASREKKGTRGPNIQRVELVAESLNCWTTRKAQ